MQDLCYCVISDKLSHSNWINISSLLKVLSKSHISILFVGLHLMQTDIVAIECLDSLVTSLICILFLIVFCIVCVLCDFSSRIFCNMHK
jgi:hypothetical protein